MKMQFIKKSGRLVPAFDEGLEVLAKIKNGDIIDVTFSRPRSQKFHKLFYAMLRIVFDNMTWEEDMRMRMKYMRPDYLLQDIKLGIGHKYTFIFPSGRIREFSRSISFASMDEDEFSIFFNRAVDYIIAEIIPMDKTALLHEVYQMVGIPLSMMENEND